MKRAGIILCGGRSSRMGRAKAWLPWFGSSMIEHVVESLLPVVEEVIVVTSSELDLPPLPARIVIDRAEGAGPLAGIREGLAATGADSAFVTSVDAPFIRSEFVEGMFAFGCAAAPIAEGHVQVLSAIYPCASARKKVDELLAEGIRRPLRLLESLNYKTIEFADSEDPQAWSGFNSPDEYLSALRTLDPASTAELEFLGRASKMANRSRVEVPVGTLGEIFSEFPGLSEPNGLIVEGRIRKSYLVCLGGRDLVRDLSVPVGPGEKVSVIDALSGG